MKFVKFPIIDIAVHVLDMQAAVTQIIAWAKARESRYVSVANVHMVMEAHDDPAFRQVINTSDLVVPDGMPLVWMLRWAGKSQAARVRGPDLMLQLCQSAASEGLAIGLYGSTPHILQQLVHNLKTRYPALQITYTYSPPFRALTPSEDAEIVKAINASGARILFVGLGCPKQEWWMAQHKEKVQALMVGVGAAFDFHAGVKPQAPLWMQRNGLEWLFRLLTEPRRLWRRYLFHNTRFVVLSARQWRRQRRGK